MQKMHNAITVIVVGIMIGYSWCYHHHNQQAQNDYIGLTEYQNIAIDTTRPHHIISRKYLTDKR